jgi:cell division protein ZapE
MSALLDAYRAKLGDGAIKPDMAQALAVEKLSLLARALGAYKPDPRPGFWRASLGFARKFGLEQAGAPPAGLYIFGGVGRGKSMLMDLFFAHAPVEKKRRVHFHAFMLEVHARIHAWRQSGEAKKGDGDPIPPLAQTLADEAWLLCFDEFQVTNIADAMILWRLFATLLEEGVTVVTTSNRVPDDLYKNGLQRDRFQPFIDLLKAKLDIHALDTGRDYRMARLREMDKYLVPAGPWADRKLDEDFAALTNDAQGARRVLRTQGRDVIVPHAAPGVAMARFEDWCGKPMGAADYLCIAEHFHTVLLRDIPRLTAKNRDRAWRFITLIDAFYEKKVKLICSAEAAPDKLYTEGDGTFEFERTVSRLMEMQSPEYLALDHIAESDEEPTKP